MNENVEQHQVQKQNSEDILCDVQCKRVRYVFGRRRVKDGKIMERRDYYYHIWFRNL